MAHLEAISSQYGPRLPALHAARFSLSPDVVAFRGLPQPTPDQTLVSRSVQNK
jgi:hypothetical protein